MSDESDPNDGSDPKPDQEAPQAVELPVDEPARESTRPPDLIKPARRRSGWPSYPGRKGDKEYLN